MKFSAFLKDKLIAAFLLGGLGVFLLVFLNVLSVGAYAAGFIVVVYAGAVVFVFGREYAQKRAYYNAVMETFRKLDQKYLVSELVEPGDFAESALLYELLRGAGKSMSDRVAELERISRDYREYIETWVHEIKTPIASALLTAQNNRGEAMARVEEDLASISSLVQKALYYARSNDVEKDYIIKETSLAKLVNSALARNARQLIQNKISVETPGTDMPIYTDEKWLDFILGQIIGNAVKYAAANGRRLIFSAEPLCRGAILSICDNGIGIPEKDLPRVFGKGFTGENGRLYAKSTGMGLYLCKKLCDRLGVAISMRSDGPGKGACVSLTFPASGFYIGAV